MKLLLDMGLARSTPYTCERKATTRCIYEINVFNA